MCEKPTWQQHSSKCIFSKSWLAATVRSFSVLTLHRRRRRDNCEKNVDVSRPYVIQREFYWCVRVDYCIFRDRGSLWRVFPVVSVPKDILRTYNFKQINVSASVYIRNHVSTGSFWNLRTGFARGRRLNVRDRQLSHSQARSSAVRSRVYKIDRSAASRYFRAGENKLRRNTNDMEDLGFSDRNREILGRC